MPSLDDEVLSAFLTPTEVSEISGSLLQSSDSEARMIGRYMEDSFPYSYLKDAGIYRPIEISAAAAPDPEEVLDVAIYGVRWAIRLACSTQVLLRTNG